MGRAPCCEKAEVKKGPWSIHEDRILMNYIALHGHPNWRALPKQAGLKRCGKSCRLRWFNYLKPDIKRGNFSREEEEAIINLHQLLGNKWSAIAARLPGRTDNEIKNVWHTHLKKRLVVINSNKDDDDDDDHKKQQQQQPPASSTETYASSLSSPDSGGDQASSSSKSTVDDYLGSTTFPEIDHTFLSQVLSDDQYSDFSSTDPIFAAAAQDQYSSSSSSSDTDDQFWYNLYTTAAAEAATAGGGDDHYSLGHNLPDTITFDDSLIYLPL